MKSEFNGCGACGGFWKWFRPPHHNFFRDECNVHDELYNIGGDKFDRHIADIILLRNMLIRVNSYFHKRKPLSKLWLIFLSYGYYYTVRIFAKNQFNFNKQ